MKILAISGSLRAWSSNTAVVRAARLLAPPEVEVAIYEGLAALPPFNPDEDVEPLPPAVADLRAEVARAGAGFALAWRSTTGAGPRRVAQPAAATISSTTRAHFAVFKLFRPPSARSAPGRAPTR
jgi:hypothetical protein